MRRGSIGLATFAMVLGCLAAASPLSGQAKNKTQQQQQQPAPKPPEPMVIRLESASRGNYFGHEAMVVSGREVMSGKSVRIGIENEPPAKKFGPVAYKPKEQIRSVFDEAKPGELIRLEIKITPRDNLNWIEKAEVYKGIPHEEEPNVFLLTDSHKEQKDGTEVYFIELSKFAQKFECYANMVKDGKTQVPDPQIVSTAELLGKDRPVEVTVTQRGKTRVITSLDGYQDAKTATFVKVGEVEENGGKFPAVEMTEEQTPITVILPGKTVETKWVPDQGMLAELKKFKSGTLLSYKTRDLADKTVLRQITQVKTSKAKPETPATKPAAPAKAAGKTGQKEPAAKDPASKDPASKDAGSKDSDGKESGNKSE